MESRSQTRLDVFVAERHSLLHREKKKKKKRSTHPFLSLHVETAVFNVPVLDRCDGTIPERLRLHVERFHFMVITGVK